VAGEGGGIARLKGCWRRSSVSGCAGGGAWPARALAAGGIAQQQGVDGHGRRMKERPASRA
jgi:hypothetical protein